MVKMTPAEKAERADARAKTRARNDALQAEEDNERAKAQRANWVREEMYLTREQAEAGEACRGCGQPIFDGSGGWTAGTINMDSTERSEYEAADASYKEHHLSCRAARWSMQGSRTQHCFHCCPPIPFSERAAEDLRRVLAGISPTADRDLDRWRSVLTCGHEVEGTVHTSYRKTHRANGLKVCAACEAERGVVTVELIGPVITPEIAAERESESQRAILFTAADAEVLQLRKQLSEARRHVKQLSSGLAQAERRLQQLTSEPSR